jgi:hypothetical protein
MRIHKENLKTGFGYTTLFLSLFLLTALSGCGSFLTVKPTSQDTSMAQKDVQAAVLATAIEKPEWTQEMLKVSASIVTGINAGQIMTLADVDAAVSKEATDMHFSQSTVKNVNAFMVLVTAYIQQKGQVSLTVPVQLCMVAMWTNNELGGNARCAQQLAPAAQGK